MPQLRPMMVRTPELPMSTMKANASGTPEKFDIMLRTSVKTLRTRSLASKAKRAARKATTMPTIADSRLIHTLFQMDCW